MPLSFQTLGSPALLAERDCPFRIRRRSAAGTADFRTGIFRNNRKSAAGRRPDTIIPPKPDQRRTGNFQVFRHLNDLAALRMQGRYDPRTAEAVRGSFRQGKIIIPL